MAKQQRRYAVEYKQKAVNLVESYCKSVLQIAKDLGTSDSILYKKQKQLSTQGGE